MSTSSILQRITTVYSEQEDRIRLTGETLDAGPVVLWLSQRLLLRLLPVLFNWLQGREGNAALANLMQDFAQQAAVAELARQAPVQAADGTTAWLVHSIDLAHSPEAMTLTFRGEQGQAISLTMQGKPLRQWLSIMRQAWVAGQWPLDVWPEWTGEPAQRAEAPAAVWH